MSKTMRNFSRWVTCIMASLLLTGTASCEQTYKQENTSPENTSPGGSDTQVNVSVAGKTFNVTFKPSDQPGEPPTPVVRDAQGNILEPCQFCTQKLQERLGPKCEKAKEYNINICASQINATTNEFETINVIKSMASPDCGTIVINGWPFYDC